MSGWTPAQILQILEQFGPGLLQEFVDGLLPKLVKLDLTALTHLAEGIYEQIAAKTEKEEMLAAKQTADAAIDELEAEDLSVEQKP